MYPGFWTVTVGGETMRVAAGTREAAERIAAGRIARRKRAAATAARGNGPRRSRPA